MSGASERLAWPQFDRRVLGDIAALLDSGRVNYHAGDCGRRFESKFAAWAGCRRAVSVANGTAALQLALAALGIGPGDEVVVPACTFIASALAPLQVGATPVFADLDRDQLVSVKTIERVLTPRTRAIVVVHLYGSVADLGPILALAKRRGLAVIEDCAQALGGVWHGRKVGTLGTIGCFSFCQMKHFTTGGEGGMVVTDDPALADRLASLRDHGRVARPDGAMGYAFPVLGWNFRLTEIQSAIGLRELARLDRWNLPRRRRNAEALLAALRGHPLVERLPPDGALRRNAFWLVPVVLKARKLAVPVVDFITELQRRGAGVYAIAWPYLPDEQVFDGVAVKTACPNAADLPRRTVGFWVHPTRTVADIRRDVRLFADTAERLMLERDVSPQDPRA